MNNFAQNINLTPKGRDGHVAVAYNGFMYVFGGNFDTGPLDDIWKLDTVNESWTRLESQIPNGGRYSMTGNIYREKYFILFGGEKGRNKQTNEILVFDMSMEKFVDVTSIGTPPSPRCRHASCISQNSEIVIAGGFNKEKSKSIVVGNLREINQGIEVKWRKTGFLTRGLHRHLVYPDKVNNSDVYVVVGGFGQSLMKLNTYNSRTLKHEKTFTIRDVLTATQRQPLLSDDEDRLDSTDSADKSQPIKNGKSLAGFAAVLDEVNQRVVSFGGDCASLNRYTNGMNQASSYSFGKYTSDAGNALKMFYLEWDTDSKIGVKEFSLRINEDHENLDEKYKLPNLSSRSACMFDHDRVLLFGGRRDNYFSNEVYVVNLNPDMGKSLSDIDTMFSEMKRAFNKQPSQNKRKLLKESLEKRFLNFMESLGPSDVIN